MALGRTQPLQRPVHGLRVGAGGFGPQFRFKSRRRHLVLPPIDLLSRRGRRLEARRPVKPAGNYRPLAHRMGLLRQSDKNRLRRVLGVGGVAQVPQADRINHVHMARHHLRKGRLRPRPRVLP